MNSSQDGFYVQFGAGNEAVDGWMNFDASPRLRLQRIPVVGKLFYGGCIFDKDVVYGDIVSLPVRPNTVVGLFGSHVFSICLTMILIALYNSFEILRRRPEAYCS